jgi:fructose-1-phosphate kinase PfkB-like protein
MLAAAAMELVRGAEPTEWLRAGLATATAGVQCPAGELAGRASVAAMLRRITVQT